VAAAAEEAIGDRQRQARIDVEDADAHERLDLEQGQVGGTREGFAELRVGDGRERAILRPNSIRRNSDSRALR
jgi:hypothetical protein